MLAVENPSMLNYIEQTKNHNESSTFINVLVEIDFARFNVCLIALNSSKNVEFWLFYQQGSGITHFAINFIMFVYAP